MTIIISITLVEIHEIRHHSCHTHTLPPHPQPVYARDLVLEAAMDLAVLVSRASLMLPSEASGKLITFAVRVV